MYNALKGFNNVNSLVVPGPINDKMIGFTPAGHTKVWVNENFGMNYPVHYNEDNELHEGDLIHNITSAIAPHGEFSPDYINALRNSGSINNALNFIRQNGGVSSDILEANRIDVARHALHGTQNVGILHDNVHVDSHLPTHTNVAHHTTTSHLNSGYAPSTAFNHQHHEPLGYQHHTGHVQHSNVHFNYPTATTAHHTSDNYGYRQQSVGGYESNRYTTTEVAGVDNRNTNKFSFTGHN
jgi:hypothetical protein